MFKQFSLFKHHNTNFHNIFLSTRIFTIFFHSHVFSQYLNNITKKLLSNCLKILITYLNLVTKLTNYGIIKKEKKKKKSVCGGDMGKGRQDSSCENVVAKGTYSVYLDTAYFVEN